MAVVVLPADARGGHGLGGHRGLGGRGFAGEGFAGHGMRGDQFATGGRHGNDYYAKAASAERDRLLNTQIKSICGGG